MRYLLKVLCTWYPDFVMWCVVKGNPYNCIYVLWLRLLEIDWNTAPSVKSWIEENRSMLNTHMWNLWYIVFEWNGGSMCIFKLTRCNKMLYVILFPTFYSKRRWMVISFEVLWHTSQLFEPLWGSLFYAH